MSSHAYPLPISSTLRFPFLRYSLFTSVIVIGWETGANVLDPLFHHPAYPAFSDHALLALAILLVSGHLGGSVVERASIKKDLGSEQLKVTADVSN